MHRNYNCNTTMALLIKKTLYIIITILSFQFKPLLSDENYFYILGAKPIDSGFDYRFLNSISAQKFSEEALKIGFGRDINKYLFN